MGMCLQRLVIEFNFQAGEMTNLIKDIQHTDTIVPLETIRYIRHLAKENNIQGLSIALVKLVPKSSARQDRCQVNKQCITLGKATAAGDPINPMVSISGILLASSYSTSQNLQRLLTLPFLTWRCSYMQSLFALGSNAKLFTAIAIGMLIHRKVKLPDGERLTWKSKMKDLLPVWKLMDEYASEHATFIDVLCESFASKGMPQTHGLITAMRSGLPIHVYAYS